MILYIHGFSSHGYGGKAKALRAYCKEKNIPFMAPSLSYIPDLAIQTLEELIEECEDIGLIGSSLGGYYAMYLSEKYNLRSVLINPSIHPQKTLAQALGMVPNYYDGSLFEWKKSHLEMLDNYSTDIIDPHNFLLMVQKCDEVLDYREAVDKLADAELIAEEGGGHGFDGVERYFERMVSFLEI